MSMANRILRSLRAMESGKVVTPKHFYAFGSPTTVRQSLNRLTQEKKIVRIRQGLYYRPKKHPILGALSPDPYAVIEALLYGSGARWQVSGAYAANRLGISEQVPAKIEVFTDGAPRQIKLGKLTLTFRRAAARNLVGAGSKPGLVIQALRWIGKGRMSSKEISILQRQLSPAEKVALLRLKKNIPVWMHSIVDQVCASDTSGRRPKHE